MQSILDSLFSALDLEIHLDILALKLSRRLKNLVRESCELISMAKTPIVDILHAVH